MSVRHYTFFESYTPAYVMPKNVIRLGREQFTFRNPVPTVRFMIVGDAPLERRTRTNYIFRRTHAPAAFQSLAGVPFSIPRREAEISEPSLFFALHWIRCVLYPEVHEAYGALY